MRQPPGDDDAQRGTKVALALLAVYFIWGSTYLGLHFALESFPPFLLGGIRYTIAGALLYAYLRKRGARAPTAAEWRAATVLGTLFFALGNGLVAVAQQRSVDSGVAAIVVATSSLWTVLFDRFSGARPRRGELLGLLLGLTGIVLLQRGGAFAGTTIGFIAIVLAPIAWALASVLSPRMQLPAGPIASAAEMLAGGCVMLGIGVLSGERFGAITAQALVALAYLILFGSIVAFSAFGFLLRTTRPALATSCAFVNPIVALALGALWGDELLTVSHVAACVLSAVGVLFVLRARVSP